MYDVKLSTQAFPMPLSDFVHFRFLAGKMPLSTNREIVLKLGFS